MQNQKGFIKMLLVIIAVIIVVGFVYMRMNLRTEKTPNNVVDDFPVSETGSASSVSVADTKDEEDIVSTLVLKKAVERHGISNGFEIYYSSGIDEMAKNVLDTKNNLYFKDTCDGSAKKYTVSITEKQKKDIYEAVLKNDLLNIKSDFTENCDGDVCSSVMPLEIATLEVSFGGKTKTIKWRGDYINNDDPALKRFLNTTDIIQDVISKIEDQNKIEPKGGCGYL